MSMSQEARSLDPRAKRTHRLLVGAFQELLRERSLESISIQDIADRATVNRATFYAHFPDKFALMDALVREQFQGVLARHLPPQAGWNWDSLRALVRAIFDFLSEARQDCHAHTGSSLALSKHAVQQELAGHLLLWLKTARVARRRPDVSPELIASTVSWAIFGPASDWKHDTLVLSIDEMTHQMLLVITAGLASFTPDFLPE